MSLTAFPSFFRYVIGIMTELGFLFACLAPMSAFNLMEYASLIAYPVILFGSALLASAISKSYECEVAFHASEQYEEVRDEDIISIEDEK